MIPLCFIHVLHCITTVFGGRRLMKHSWELQIESVTSHSLLSSGSLRLPGSLELSLWTGMTKQPCSLMAWRKRHRGGHSAPLPPPLQGTTAPISAQLSPPRQRCHLLVTVGAGHLTPAERAVPYSTF